MEKSHRESMLNAVAVAFLILVIMALIMIYYNQNKQLSKIGPSITKQTIVYMNSKYGDSFKVIETGVSPFDNKSNSYSLLLSTVSFPNEPVLVEVEYGNQVDKDETGSLYSGIKYKENYMAIEYEDEISEVILDAFKVYYQDVSVKYDVYSGMQSNLETHVRFRSYIDSLESTVRAVVEIQSDGTGYDLGILTNIMNEIQLHIANIDLTVLYLDSLEFGKYDIYELYCKFDLGQFKYGVRIEGRADSLNMYVSGDTEDIEVNRLNNLKKMATQYLRDKYGIAVSVFDIKELSQDLAVFNMYSKYYPVDMIIVTIENYAGDKPVYKDNYKTIQYKSKIQDLIRAYAALEFTQYKMDYQIDMQSVSGSFEQASKFEDFMDSEDLSLGTIYIVIPQSEYESYSEDEFKNKLRSFGEDIAYHKKEFVVDILVVPNMDFTFSTDTLFDMNYRKDSSIYYRLLKVVGNSNVSISRYDCNTESEV